MCAFRINFFWVIALTLLVGGCATGGGKSGGDSAMISSNMTAPFDMGEYGNETKVQGQGSRQPSTASAKQLGGVTPGNAKRERVASDNTPKKPEAEQLLSSRSSWYAKGLPLRVAVEQIIGASNVGVIWDSGVNQDSQVALNMTNTTRYAALRQAVNAVGYGVRFRGNTVFVDKQISRVYRMPAEVGSLSLMRSNGTVGNNGNGVNGNGVNGNTSNSSAYSGYQSNSNGGTGASDSGSQVLTRNAKYDFWGTLKTALSKMISPDGVYTISPETQLVTITDDYSHVTRIQDYLHSIWNLSKYAATIDLRVVRVDLNRQHQSGIQWNIAADIAKNAVGGAVQLTSQGLFMPPATGLPNATAGVKVTNKGVFSIADILAKSLSQFGHVVSITKPRIHVENGVPYAISMVNQRDIVSSTTVLTGTAGSPSQVTANTETITQGLQLSLTPFIYNQNSIHVEVLPDISKLNGEPVTFDLGNGSKVQLKNINKDSFFLNVDAKNNETVMLSGLLVENDSNTDTDPLASKIPLIGDVFKQKLNRKQRSEFVIIMTPHITVRDIGDFVVELAS